ncbi:WASH complex subunit strumpellin-like [Tropilaelaps mercedesae]|uniref:WASH complex subunit strumpellin-like n=1 Tax=Tropilaelaps mercedesae TaxID=418985 RepID=A0A1V9XP74_9ACAR|nr:WASH complex subunit strumpellin-like [Tropilaelaps mercedesae]
MDFLAENNPCGQTLLRVVSQGNAIMAELTRLTSMVPQQLTHDRYAEILPDFSYFKNSEAFEKRLDADSRLADMDALFKENHLELLSKFYLVFECAHRYTVELNQFLEELNDGTYIQQNLESALNNVEGKQLLAEAVYTCGVILLFIDEKFEGVIRERMLVLYYRYSAQRSDLGANVDDVCKLFRSTGYVARTKTRPAGYPEDYFKRASIDPQFVSFLLGRLRSDDIYNHIPLYPQPEHRSAALSNQSALIYMALFFNARILHQEAAIMREIVDKYFADNWVIATYMGNVVNLVDAWEPYRAARTALQNVQDLKSVQTRCDDMHKQLDRLLPQTEALLKEGVLTDDMVLDKVQKLMAAARECNVTLRWLLLHTSMTPEPVTKRARQLRDVVLQKHDALRLFKLLLSTAEFEHKLKERFQKLLRQKDEKWTALRKESSERLHELSEVYSGSKPLTRIEKNERLQKWFEDIARQVANLTYENPVAISRKIIQLINALKEVQNFHQIEGNIQVRQFLQESRQFLHSMLRLLSVKGELLTQLDVIADVSYAWLLIDAYTKHMQSGIKTNPEMVVKLQATFLKLALALGLPLRRINQAGSRDMETVSTFYSQELVSYIRRVLHIIPETMFSLLARIIQIQTSHLRQLPTRLMKDQLKQFAQVDERAEVAKLSHDICVFTDGVLEMKTTLVGIVKIDPRQLLEDGIRKELVNQLSLALHQTLTFQARPKGGELVERLQTLANIVSGYYRSFEYVQDYIGIRGLKMFQEEFARIVNYNVELECNAYIRHEIHDWDSVYQSRKIPIPRYPPTCSMARTFAGRLANEFSRITDPRLTVYVDSLCTWHNRTTHDEVLTMKDFSLLLRAVGAVGMVGLDRVYAFRISVELRDIINSLSKTLDEQVWIEGLASVQQGMKKASTDGMARLWAPSATKIAKAYPNLVNSLMRIGQLILLRRHVAHELYKNAKFNAKNLSAALSTLNDAILLNLPARTTQSDNELLDRLSSHLRYAGLFDPAKQVYNVGPAHTIPNLAMFLALFTTTCMPKFAYSRTLGCLLAKPKQTVDCVPFTLGVFVFLGQFHTDYKDAYVRLLCRYLKACTLSLLPAGKSNPDVTSLLTYLDYASIELDCIDRQLLIEQLPEFILTQYKNLLVL